MAPSASGVPLEDECVNEFLKLKKTRSYRYITFGINDEATKVSVVDTGARDKTYDDFTKLFPDDDCRYGVYDHDFEDSEGCQKSKMVFFAWVPDTAKVKKKMLYASTKDTLKQALDGISFEIQATDAEELGVKYVQEKCQ
mmetsp:Transcript_21514/g.25909  ORF Transcript_21514/g.25909 Transcript_21514/m.25909 type:complete len:140 (+) Transcript_21514:137-556(+)|eukprot:CAMPEP_0197846558 /NCGR_PEP_ID=MMETSP1438-20131217/3509_1 /TAXON_ID=1461541 /ORGANISM="Pterosperma sp., Strain CCMP1384" /LENGTH=139 /DNA_ID=CAMNT_0043458249 /DNA_START=132 /DNA_END=551 /DNA_ORIENTATION=+